MRDEEVTKCLKNCISRKCAECSMEGKCFPELPSSALGLIERLQAEIKTLKSESDEFEESYNRERDYACELYEELSDDNENDVVNHPSHYETGKF